MPELKDNPELNLEQDFKAKLLKLVDVLKKEAAYAEKTESQDLDLATLKNLLQKTENNIAKIILDQLTSFPKEESVKQTWSFDIPFVERGLADTVHIQISKDNDADQASETNNDLANWSVNLTLNPPGLGPIQCHLSYHNEVINTLFRSQQPRTTHIITQHLGHLQQQFEAAGLKSGAINVQEGNQVHAPTYPNRPQTWFDEKV